MQLEKLKLVNFESAEARLERFLSNNDKRPNFIKRNVYNALGWNVVAVLESPKPEEGIIEQTHHFMGPMLHVDRKFSIFHALKYYLNPEIPLSFKLSEIKKRTEAGKKWVVGCNQITNDGEIAYAQEGASEAPAANEDFFATALSRMQLANPAVQNAILATDTWAQFDNPGAAAIAGSNKVYDATYPNRNDADGDNTGSGVDILSFLTSYTTADFNDAGTTIKNFAILDNAAPVAGTKLLTHGQITPFNKTATDTLKFFINHEMRRV